MVHTVLGPGVRRYTPGDLHEVVWLVSIQNGYDPQKEEEAGGLCVRACVLRDDMSTNFKHSSANAKGSLLIK